MPDQLFESEVYTSAIYLLVTMVESILVTGAVACLVRFVTRKKLKGLTEEEWPERNRVMFSLNNFIIGALFSVVIGQIMLANWRLDNDIVFYIQFFSIVVIGSLWSKWVFNDLNDTLGKPRKSFLRQFKSAVSIPVLFLSYFIVGAFGIKFYFGQELFIKAIVVSGVALLTYIVAYGGHLRLLTWVGLMRPANERIQKIVDSLGREVNFVVHRVYEFSFPGANAVAFPLNGVLAVSEDAIEQLSDSELRAILAHEMGHLLEPTNVVFKRMLSAYVFPLFFIFVFGYELLSGVEPPWYGMVLGGYFILTVVGLIRGRNFDHDQEFAADQVGVKLTTRDTFGEALEKVHKLSFLPIHFGKKKLSHPNLTSRLKAIGYDFKYKEVEAPPSFAGQTTAVIFSAIFMIVAFKAAPVYLANESNEISLSAKVLVATQGPSGQIYYDIARKMIPEDSERAVSYLKRADNSGSSMRTYSFKAIKGLVGVGECQKAQQVYDLLHQDQKHVRKLINHNRAENQKAYLQLIESLDGCVEE